MVYHFLSFINFSSVDRGGNIKWIEKMNLSYDKCILKKISL